MNELLERSACHSSVIGCCEAHICSRAADSWVSCVPWVTWPPAFQ